MSINLKSYQQKAVDQLVSKTIELLHTDGPGEVCVFQAPTGSGKTVMTAKFIEILIKELPEEDICFVWMSIGKGQLHIQSKERLEEIFQGSPRVSLIEDEFTGGRERIVRNEVVVANWEKIRNKDKTDDWSNIIMREGEITNFRDVLEKTREQRKLVLIIDESHVSAATERANELRKIISADVVIEMSATPRLMPSLLDVTKGLAGYIRVEPNDVIEEGMIKKEVLINENIGKIAEIDVDSQTVVLQAAYEKRIQLENMYMQVGSSIKPLVLIQIPSSDAGDIKIEAVKQFLAEKGVTEKNEKLAIWLSEQKSTTIGSLRSSESTVEFLIFKQAIDTGWDCPRAQILIKFREVRNEVFEIQTVGRILRMPEQKHYSEEKLNKAYIFTNLESFDVKKEDYNPNIINHLKAIRTKEYLQLNISSYFKARADYGDVTSSFSKVFQETANDYFKIPNDSTKQQAKTLIEKRGLILSLKNYTHNIISNTSVKATSFDEIEGKISPKEYAHLILAINDLHSLFEKIIQQTLGTFTNVKRSVPSVKTAIYSWFRNKLASEEWDEEIILIQQIVALEGNRVHFEKILSQAINKYKHVKDKEVQQRILASEQWYDFELPFELFFNKHEDEKVVAKSYAYDPCYLSYSRSEPEKRFESFINSNAESINWWWKNGEGKKEYFGIKYEYAGSIHVFYPDYLVQLKDGRTGFFEVKDSSDRDGASFTKSKAEALASWVKVQKNKKIFGGVVIEKNKTWLLNSSGVYNWSKCELNNWEDWTELML
jgi:type III restriction enzyme